MCKQDPHKDDLDADFDTLRAAPRPGVGYRPERNNMAGNASSNASSNVSSSVTELQERRAMIGLSMIDGLGPRRMHKLIAHFGSARAAMEASSRDLGHIAGIGKQCAAKISSYQLDAAVDRQIELADRIGAYLIAEQDDRYPALLREIHLPPPFLWARGSIPTRPFISIVGTRRPTDYGRHVARKLSAELVRAGYAVVSGLAYGIDAVVHQSVLDSFGSTVAVFGSGIDIVYPGRHVALARQIEESGALVSEFALGTKPNGSNFPQRNRIISGMSEGVILVEAFEKGGALITASFALEQNREVFAVPGRATTLAAAGTNQLIRDGAAKLVLSVQDVLAELKPTFTRFKPQVSTTNPAHPDNLDAASSQVIEALGADLVHIDEIVNRASMPMKDILSSLLTLEVLGVVKQYPGRVFDAV